jgi:hypothetical protein
MVAAAALNLLDAGVVTRPSQAAALLHLQCLHLSHYALERSNSLEQQQKKGHVLLPSRLAVLQQ